jgi:hypothetical protein
VALEREEDVGSSDGDEALAESRFKQVSEELEKAHQEMAVGAMMSILEANEIASDDEEEANAEKRRRKKKNKRKASLECDQDDLLRTPWIES